MHLHFHELVHSDLTPCSVQINGQGFGESAENFGDFCGDQQVARNYVEKAQMLGEQLARLHRRLQLLRVRFVAKHATSIEHVFNKPWL